MSSLIQKIQKSSKRRNDSVSNVILSDAEGQLSKLRTTGLSSKFKLIESKTPLAEEGQFSAGDSPESLWLESVSVVSSEVAIFLNSAFQILDEICSERSVSEIDERALITTVVERARRLHAGEFFLSRYDLAIVEHELKQILLGLGPIGGLFKDKEVSEIFIDTYQGISVRSDRKIVTTPVSFRSPLEYKLFLMFLEKRASEQSSATVNSKQFVIRGEDIIRCSVLLPQGDSKVEPRLCMRISRPRQVSFYDLLRDKFLPPSLASWLGELSSSRLANIIVIGESGSGKSRLVSALLNATPSNERIITVEELPEIELSHAGHESLIISDVNREQGASSLLHLGVQRAPHRIALDEIKGLEAAAFLSILEQGLDGSVSTINSKNVRDGLWKFCDLVLRADLSPEASVVRRIERATRIILKTSVADGKPVLSGIYELVPSPRAPFTIREIVRFTGIKKDLRSWAICSDQTPIVKLLNEKLGVELQPGSGLEKIL